MNTRQRRFLAVAFPSVLLATSCAFAASLQNGSFSEGTDAPQNWEKPKDAQTIFARDTNTFRSAPASLRLDGTGTVQQIISAPDKTFTLQGATKTQGDVTALRYDLQVFDAAWKQLAWITSDDNDANKLRPSADWQPFSRDVTLPDGTANVILYVTATGTGQTWIDDVSTAPPVAPPRADFNPNADKTPIQVGPPAKLLAPTPYSYGHATMGGVEYATSVIFNPKRPELMYSRNDTGSIYQFDRKRERWVSLMDNLPWKWSNLFVADSFALDANNVGTIYIAAGGSRWEADFDVLKTTNNGKSWSRLNVKNERGEPVRSEAGSEHKPAGERIQVDPNDSNIVWFGTRFDGLLCSRDAGKTWSRVKSFPAVGGGRSGLTFVTLDWKATKTGPTQTIYVGVSTGKEGDDASKPDGLGGVYRSRDGGKTWQLLNQDTGPDRKSTPIRGRLGIDGTLYVSFAGGAGLQKFADETWTDITPTQGKGEAFSGIGPHPTDARQLVAITMSEKVPMFYSRDGGASWTTYKHEVNGTGNVDLVFQPAWELVTGEYNWPRGYCATFEFDPFDPTRVYETDFSGVNLVKGIGTQRLKVSLLSAGREQMTMGDVVSPSAGAPLISGAWDIGGFRHTDFNAIPDERLQVRKPDGSPYTGWDTYRNGFNDLFQLDANPHNPNDIVASGGWPWNHTGDLGVSRDNGKTFRVTPTKPFPDAQFGRVALARDPNNIVWAPFKDAQTPVYFSRDGGATWQTSQGAPVGTVAPEQYISFYKMLAADRELPNTFYLYDRRDGRFYRSQDGGANWKHISTLPKQQGVHWDVHRVEAAPGMAGVVWCALRDGGLFTSRNGGQSWTKIPNVRWAQSFAFGKGRANRPAVYLFGQIDGKQTSVKEEAELRLYRSDDMGATWTRVHDETHGFTDLRSMAGDHQKFGRVYVATGGRGVFVGVPR